jgi:hypothetical protein
MVFQLFAFSLPRGKLTIFQLRIFCRFQKAADATKASVPAASADTTSSVGFSAATESTRELEHPFSSNVNM